MNKSQTLDQLTDVIDDIIDQIEKIHTDDLPNRVQYKLGDIVYHLDTAAALMEQTRTTIELHLE